MSLREGEGASVTVLICTRNGHSRGFLNQAIRSAFGQTMPPLEVLLVDDGSTDGTVAELQRTMPEVRVLPNPGTGLAAARNAGVRAARGQWIAFLDDDDLWLPTKLAEQMAQVAKARCPERTIWATRLAYIGKSGGMPVPVSAVEPFFSWPTCLLGSPVAPSGVLVAKALLGEKGPFLECVPAGAAYLFWIDCLKGGATVCYSEPILVHIRRHHPQMTDASHQVDLSLALDALLLPYFHALPPALDERLRAVRILLIARSLARQCGLTQAATFWGRTPLGPPRLGWHALTYFLLDSAACRAPQRPARWLRQAALGLLLKDSKRGQPDSGLESNGGGFGADSAAGSGLPAIKQPGP